MTYLFAVAGDEDNGLGVVWLDKWFSQVSNAHSVAIPIVTRIIKPMIFKVNSDIPKELTGSKFESIALLKAMVHPIKRASINQKNPAARDMRGIDGERFCLSRSNLARIITDIRTMNMGMRYKSTAIGPGNGT